jgi:zinc protease
VTGWMLTASITPAEFRREHQVVQRELELGKANADRVFYYLAEYNRYRVSPMHVPVIGYQEVIQSLTREDVVAYYKMAYVPNNMIFSVSGDVDPETMLATVRGYLTDFPPGRGFSHNIVPEPPVVAPRTVVATFPQLGQARMELAFPSVRLDNPDLYALDLLAQILGGSESSVLIQDLRDKDRIVTSIAAGDMTPSYVDGSFEIEAQLDPDKIETVKQAILAHVEAIKAHPPDAETMRTAQTLMRMDRLKGLQTAQDWASSLALDYLTSGDAHFSDRYVDRIAKVTAEQVQDAARRYLSSDKLLTTILLPAEAVGAAGPPKAADLIAAATTTGPAGGAQAAVASPKVQRIVLPNNAVLLLKRITTTPLVSINVYSLGGLSAETAANNGIGNMAMFACPRGTHDYTGEQIAQYFDSIGGTINTVCGNNTWYWSAQVLNTDFPQAMTRFCDIIDNATFPDTAIENIRPRALAEIANQDSSWDARAFRYFRSAYFGPANSPYQFTAPGSKANVAAFTSDDLRKWYADHILAGRRVIAIYGDVDPAIATDMATKLLGTGPRLPDAVPMQYPPTPAPAAPAAVAHIDVQDVKIQKTEQDTAGIVIGFKSNSLIGEPLAPTLDTNTTLCAGFAYPTGYIFETLRGLGLVYEAAAYNWPGRSNSIPGTFVAYAGTDPKNVNQVVDLILLNIARMQGSDADMQSDWFKRAKELITTADALDHETPEQQASTAALDEIYGLGYDFHDSYASKINSVTFDQIRAAAGQRLSQCVITICTSHPELVTEKTGTRTYTQFPPVDLTPRGVQFDTGAQK